MPRFTVDTSKIKAKQVQYDKTASKTFQKNNFWDPKEGVNRIRILPPWSEERVWFREIPYHYGIGGKTVVCPKRLLNKPCFVCDKVSEFRKSPDKALNDTANDLRPKTRVYYNIVDLDDIGKGVQVYGSGVTVFNDLLYYDLDPDWGNITDVADGYDILLTRTGKGRNSKYKVTAKKNSSPLENEGWLDSLNNLDNLVGKILSPEEMKALYESSGDEDEVVEKPTEVAPKRSLDTVIKEEKDVPIDIEEIPDEIPSKKEEVITPQSDDSTVTLEAKDVKAMNRKALKQLIMDLDLEINPKQYDDDKDLQNAIISVCGLEEDDTDVLEEKDVDRPGCFGLEFVETDVDCTNCAVSKPCKVEFKAKKKK